MATPKLRADFNGLFGDVLCLSGLNRWAEELRHVFRLSI
jgi:hypothetical protein